MRLDQPDSAALVCINSIDADGPIPVSELCPIYLNANFNQRYKACQDSLIATLDHTTRVNHAKKIEVWSAELVEELQDLKNINTFSYFYEQLLYLLLSLLIGVDCRVKFKYQIESALDHARALMPILTYRTRARYALQIELRKILQEALNNPQFQTEQNILFQVKCLLAAENPSAEMVLLDYLACATTLMHYHTTSAITSSLYWLARYPIWQQRIAEESETLTISSAVVKESVRLFPPLISVAKQLQKDIVVNNYSLPADTCTGINLYALHRDPAYWSAPNAFQPERFLDPNSMRHPFQFMPFGQHQLDAVETQLPMAFAQTIVAGVGRFLRTQFLNQQPIHFTSAPVWRPRGKLQLRFDDLKLQE